MKRQKIAIIGGGLTGCCIAVSLADKFNQITIFESGLQPVGEASLYNEGKIHLGYTYGMDKSLKTAKLMAESASMFEKLLKSWFGKEISKVSRSTYFNYAVHKNGLLNPDDYYSYAKKVGQIVKDSFKGKTYFGISPSQTPVKLSTKQVGSQYNSSVVSSVIKTNEICIDPLEIARIVRKQIVKIPGVIVRCKTEVLSVKFQRSKITLILRTPDELQEEESFDFVINASWRNLLNLDFSAGMKPPKNPLFRLKYFIKTKTKITNAPSTTIVLGKFGDIITFNNFNCFSWYPAGRIDWYQGLNPKKVDPILKKEPLTTDIKKAIIKGLSTIMPGLDKVPKEEWDLIGNWIYAPSVSDIDSAVSQLHKRTQIGITQLSNYFSVNPGKYTSVPYFAQKIAMKFK